MKKTEDVGIEIGFGMVRQKAKSSAVCVHAIGKAGERVLKRELDGVLKHHNKR